CTRLDGLVERARQGLVLDPELAACTTRLESHDPDGLVPTAITPGITFGLAERPQSSHGQTVRRRPDGSSASQGRIGLWQPGRRNSATPSRSIVRAGSRPTDTRRSTSTRRGRRSTWFSPAWCAARYRACGSTPT